MPTTAYHRNPTSISSKGNGMLLPILGSYEVYPIKGLTYYSIPWKLLRAYPEKK
jgi:hypothetical protein